MPTKETWNMNTKISVEQLLIELRKIASIDDQIWQESLSDRKLKEIEFQKII